MASPIRMVSPSRVPRRCEYLTDPITDDQTHSHPASPAKGHVQVQSEETREPLVEQQAVSQSASELEPGEIPTANVTSDAIPKHQIEPQIDPQLEAEAELPPADITNAGIGESSR